LKIDLVKAHRLYIEHSLRKSNGRQAGWLLSVMLTFVTLFSQGFATAPAPASKPVQTELALLNGERLKKAFSIRGFSTLKSNNVRYQLHKTFRLRIQFLTNSVRTQFFENTIVRNSITPLACVLTRNTHQSRYNEDFLS
jgi:hypothetical protein